MKVLAHIITIGGIILYFIAKHESNRPASASRKADAVEAKPSPEELERQKQELLKDIRETTIRISNLEKLALYAKGDYADQLESERQQQEQKLQELKPALSEVLKKQKEYKASTAEALSHTERLAHQTADTFSDSDTHSDSQQSNLSIKNMEKAGKRPRRWGCGILIAVPVIIGIAILSGPAITYQRALHLIENGNYEKAADILLDIAPEYKDSLWLWDYADTRAEYGESPSGKAAVEAYDSLEVTVKYSQSLPCYDEICEYTNEIKIAADKQTAINKENAEKERQQHRTKAKAGIPYIGMPEEFINSTTLGQSYSHYQSDGYVNGKKNYYCTQYDWYIYTANFHAAVFTAWTYEGEVTDVQKKNLQYWDGDKVLGTMIPPFSGSNHASGTSGYDPYSAGDYSSADDFYYDYYNDFFDYEEAEDYWYEHN